MECNVTCFERIMHIVKPFPEESLKEAYEITIDGCLHEFLEFGVEQGCFTKIQSYTLFACIVMWEDLEGNYWEEDHDKLMALYDKVGLTREKCKELAEELEME